MRPRCLLATLSFFTFLHASSVARAEPRELAREEEPSAFGMRLGARAGYSVPGGNAFEGSGELSTTISGSVPVRVDLGLRLARHVYLGSLLQVGFIVPKGCPDDMTCSGTDIRLGAMIAYHVLPTRRFDPWIGLGAAYEMLSMKRSISSAPSTDLRFSARGLDLDVELGIGVRVTPRLQIGPALSVSMARYTSITLNGTAMNEFNTALHAWTMVGLGGTFDL